jgi:hypothetical protein
LTYALEIARDSASQLGCGLIEWKHFFESDRFQERS